MAEASKPVTWWLRWHLPHSRKYTSWHAILTTPRHWPWPLGSADGPVLVACGYQKSSRKFRNPETTSKPDKTCRLCDRALSARSEGCAPLRLRWHETQRDGFSAIGPGCSIGVTKRIDGSWHWELEVRSRSGVSAHAGDAETFDRAMLNAEAVAKAWGVKLGQHSYSIPKRRTIWLVKMRARGPYGRIDGYEAIRYARKYGVPICKYEEPGIEEKRDDLTVNEADCVATDRSPWLVYVDAMRGYAIETHRNGRWTRTGLGDEPPANFFGDEDAAKEAIEELRGLGPDWLARPYRIVALSVRNRRGKVVRAAMARQADLYTAYINGGRGGVKTFEALDDSAAVERARKWADSRDKLVKARVYWLRVMRQWRESDTRLDTLESGQYRLAVERGDIDQGDAIAIYDRDTEIVAPRRRLVGRPLGRLPLSTRRSR